MGGPFGVQHLAQGHFGMQMGQTGDRTADLQVGGRPLYPLATAAGVKMDAMTAPKGKPMSRWSADGWLQYRRTYPLTIEQEQRFRFRTGKERGNVLTIPNL
ncbi:unnamed protein product [Pleuronectes platessa]|uniref:Uncharacterized protein n=1 Tax=Pleuronectes platessa TaxID=8262 RepID=A0A9N7UWE7_PLEPL|nr:unnamed protein product [Pleuronectes platessa]